MRVIERACVKLLFLALVLFQTATLSSQEQEDWQRFRAAYPYHIQVIALSDPDANGGRTMVISEPPPSVTLDDIKSIDPALNRPDTVRHRLGVDGWVEDVIVSLPPVTPARLSTIINRLQLRLFRTSYKAYVLTIPAEATRPKLEKLICRSPPAI